MTWALTFAAFKRFWPLIVIGLAVWWVASTLNKIDTLEHKLAARNAEIEILNGVVERCRDWRQQMDILREQIVANEQLVENTLVLADEWEARFNAERRKPPRVEVEIRDQVVGDTAETMAVSGAKIASELAAGLRIRLDEEAP